MFSLLNPQKISSEQTLICYCCRVIVVSKHFMGQWELLLKLQLHFDVILHLKLWLKKKEYQSMKVSLNRSVYILRWVSVYSILLTKPLKIDYTKLDFSSEHHQMDWPYVGGGIDLVYMHAAWGRRGQGRVINFITLHGEGGPKRSKTGCSMLIVQKIPEFKI